MKRVLWVLLLVGCASNEAHPGQAIFNRNCASCHMADGSGLDGAVPPLAGSDRVLHKDQLIAVVLGGKTGALTVNGAAYNGTMPAMKFLSDEEVAQALSYMHASWGHPGEAVTEADVARVRKGN